MTDARQRTGDERLAIGSANIELLDVRYAFLIPSNTRSYSAEPQPTRLETHEPVVPNDHVMEQLDVEQLARVAQLRRRADVFK